MYNELIITEDKFYNPSTAAICDYGEKYDGLWGSDTIELTLEDVTALMSGKVLSASVNGEYAVLIRLEKTEKNRM